VPTVLVADGDPTVLAVLAGHLEAPGRTLVSADTPEAARRLVEQRGPVDVAIVDRGLGGGAGLDLVRWLKEERRETEVILITPYASYESALEALQLGLYDTFSKPIEDFDAVRLRVENALEKVRLQAARAEAEGELRHMQKMDAIGRLAGGIGHDLANVLAVILSWSEELGTRATGHELDGLQQITFAAERATRLVRQMMTLSRKGPAEPMRLTLNDAMEEVAKLLRRSLGARVELVMEPSPDPWPILVDPSHLSQVFLNLAVNARDAMPGGGKLTLRAVNVPDADFSQAGGATGPGVRLEAIDQGVGMTKEVRERIFEPFFTTKKAGEGTGLGLSIVYGIVRQAGGTIAVDSTPGVGTTFRVTFPRAAEAEAAVARVEQVRATTPLAAATVLLAEDDPPLRALVARALRGANLTVLEAGSGDEALALARAHAGEIDLLLTDGVMSGLSGPALAGVLASERPRCAVMVVTGFPSDPEVAAFAAAGGKVMQKPFRASALLETVRALLTRR